MRSLRLHNFKESLKLDIIDKLKLDCSLQYTLVKVLYSSINPSDFGFISNIYGRGNYNIYPKSIGFEGVGIIKECNSKELIGSKVSFCSNIEDKK